MKKILLLIALLFITETNYAQKKHRDEYQSYLYSLNLISKLFSRVLDNVEIIAHRPDRVSFKNLAVDFNKKVNVLLINQNGLINLINKGGFNDHHFNNSLRIMEKNITDLKKILINNRGLIDNLKIKDFNTAEVYDHLDMRLYENDELLREIHKNRSSKAFKHKVVDNLTQAVVVLNECHSKVAALYSKVK
ncbi:hypothetical protein [Mucilaginibacter sp.]|uniref:hypothetical protein n=1 Tax=Mucilaginibacter sp. TaxID=1882438 RepID=UPI00263315E3|nr:hypothetical protein [Mucilaginibacter sp.]MDB4925432.1 hypothetical protein [Mucilaginibacter sp.]